MDKNIESPWMTLQQAAKYLGLSKETIYRKIYKDKSFPKYKVGKLYRFNKQSLDRWMERHKK